MIQGLPVFASQVGAFREFVPSDWRFALDDPAGQPSMIDTADEVRFSKVARAARDDVFRFDLQNHLDNHRRLFARLVSGSSSA